tara:strand:- start:2 stop:295 length:294 start_codon:yes stop_codon:yes gene_type:complete
MAYAIIKNSLVTNIVEWDGVSEYQVDGDLILADDNAYIGGEYNGSFVSRPVEPDTRTYADKRRAEYPSIEECVHAILDDDLEALQAKRAEVKARYPK